MVISLRNKIPINKLIGKAQMVELLRQQASEREFREKRDFRLERSFLEWYLCEATMVFLPMSSWQIITN